MNIAIVTGSAGLIGSEAVAFFSNKFESVHALERVLFIYLLHTHRSEDAFTGKLREKSEVCSSMRESLRHSVKFDNTV